MVNADYLFLMTDVDCLYTDNPRTNPDAAPVEIVEDIGALREKGKTVELFSSCYFDVLRKFTNYPAH